MNTGNFIQLPQISKCRKSFHRRNVRTPFAHSHQHFARANLAQNGSRIRRQRNNSPSRPPNFSRTPNSSHRPKRIADPPKVCFATSPHLWPSPNARFLTVERFTYVWVLRFGLCRGGACPSLLGHSFSCASLLDFSFFCRDRLLRRSANLARAISVAGSRMLHSSLLRLRLELVLPLGLFLPSGTSRTLSRNTLPTLPPVMLNSRRLRVKDVRTKHSARFHAAPCQPANELTGPAKVCCTSSLSEDAACAF